MDRRVAKVLQFAKDENIEYHLSRCGILLNCDNLLLMDFMKRFNIKADVLSADPPYGINMDGDFREHKWRDKEDMFGKKDWDSEIPPDEYFTLGKQVSEHQILWGGNYFQDVIYEDKKSYIFETIDGVSYIKYKTAPMLGKTRCWVLWIKGTEAVSLADFEMAWTSFDRSCKIIRYKWNGFVQGNMKKKEKRIHPTQKPIQLYRLLNSEFIKKGQLVLETHSGSGSNPIACVDANIPYIAAEVDEDYFSKSIDRIELYKYGYNSIVTPEFKKKKGEKEKPQIGLFE